MIWIGAFVLFALAFFAAALGYVRGVIRRAARGIYRVARLLYGGRHRYRPAEAPAFSRLDLAYYERTQAWLEERGFRLLGDIEDIDLTEYAQDRSLHPLGGPERTFTRCLVSGDGTITASIAHVITPAAEMRDRRLHRFVREHRLVEFSTELSDGTIVTTLPANRADMLDPPPEIRRYLLPPDTPIDDVLERHKANVAAVLSVWKSAVALRVESVEDLIAASHREQDRKVAHRREVGWVTERELERLAGIHGRWIIKPVLREIRRLAAAEPA